MLMNELPTEDQARRLSNNWVRRSNVPVHVFKAIDALPNRTHPMTQFSIAIMAMRTRVSLQKHIQMVCTRVSIGMPLMKIA